MQFRSLAPLELPSAEPPTLDSLLAHHKRYGLGNPPRNGRGDPMSYGAYGKLAADPLVEVAIDYLGERAYTLFIEGIGYGRFAEAASKDWKEHHAA